MSAFFDAGVGVVIVDALEIFGLDPIPRDVFVCLEPYNNVSNKILDEHRVFVGTLGYRFFVRPL